MFCGKFRNIMNNIRIFYVEVNVLPRKMMKRAHANGCKCSVGKMPLDI